VELAYWSGEIVKKGDRIRYGGGSGIVELVADPDVSDPETRYYVDEYGGGCMLLTELFGRVFIDNPREAEDLQFVARLPIKPEDA
jgi:hypothetical protein